MKKLVLTLLALAFLYAPTHAGEEEKKGGWGDQPIVEDSNRADRPLVAKVAEATKRDRLSWRERRKLGLSLRSLRPIVEEMKASGEWDDEDRGAMAAEVAAKWAAENPKVASDPGVDWDAIIAFIEAILPLILMLIELFSVNTVATGIMLASALVIPTPKTWRHCREALSS